MMNIHVTSGTGTGPTPLAAFDEALLAAAKINHNMIYLSSFIPEGSVVKRGKYIVPQEKWGHRLYVVMARQDASQPGEEAWAGLGWAQNESGRGMFVEHHAKNQSDLEEAIQATLKSMMASRNEDFGALHHEIVGIKCEQQPVCAVVIAVYGDPEPWPA
jgi:arginine decarboxylase